MKITVRSVDYETDYLYEQVPFDADFLRQIPGSDGQDYWLASLPTPLRWRRDGKDTQVTHVVFASRSVGKELAAGRSRMTVSIRYVLDQSVLTDATLDPKKVEYVAIGIADAT